MVLLKRQTSGVDSSLGNYSGIQACPDLVGSLVNGTNSQFGSQSILQDDGQVLDQLMDLVSYPPDPAMEALSAQGCTGVAFLSVPDCLISMQVCAHGQLACYKIPSDCVSQLANCDAGKVCMITQAACIAASCTLGGLLLHPDSGGFMYQQKVLCRSMLVTSMLCTAQWHCGMLLHSHCRLAAVCRVQAMQAPR